MDATLEEAEDYLVNEAMNSHVGEGLEVYVLALACVRHVRDLHGNPSSAAQLEEWLIRRFTKDFLEDVDPDTEFECDGCGRVGNRDDGISADGDECPDEECDGTVHIYKEE